MAYDVNDGERVTFTYKNSSLVLADPTVVTATVTIPAGVATTYIYGTDAELVRDSTGVYHIDVTFTTAGDWTVEGHGTGAVTAATSQTFRVGTLRLLATVADVQARLGRTLTDAETTRAEALLEDASAAVRAYTGQHITADTTTVRAKVNGGTIRLTQRPVTDVATIEDTNGNDVAFTWYAGEVIQVATNVPDSWAWVPWVDGIAYVDVTYTHGYDEVPGDIVAVVCQMAARALGQAADDSGKTSETIAGYSYTVGTAAASGAVGLLPDERAVLDRYRRPAGMASIL